MTLMWIAVCWTVLALFIQWIEANTTCVSMCLHSRVFSSAQRPVHRPHVEKAAGHMKGWADPAEEHRGAELIPVKQADAH